MNAQRRGGNMENEKNGLIVQTNTDLSAVETVGDEKTVEDEKTIEDAEFREVESSQLKTGYCNYCGNSRMVYVPESWDQVEIDAQATEECDCPTATRERNYKIQKIAAEDNIRRLLEETDPEVADLLIESIGLVQRGMCNKVTIMISRQTSVTLRKSKDGSLKCDRMTNVKEETIA